MERGGYDGRDARPRGNAPVPTGVLPTRVAGRSLDYDWVADLEFGDLASDTIAFVPGMTLRWLISVAGRVGPSVQFLGPQSPDSALRQLRHIVDAWLGSHPPE